MLLQQNAARLYLRSLIVGKMTQARLALGVRAEKLGADFYILGCCLAPRVAHQLPKFDGILFSSWAPTQGHEV
jgi:hypothetical protein